MMFSNDTVRLQVAFKDFDSKNIQPTEVKLTIYDTNETVVEVIEQEALTDQSDGKWSYDYSAESSFVYEFSGTYFDKPVLARDSITVKFIR